MDQSIDVTSNLGVQKDEVKSLYQKVAQQTQSLKGRIQYIDNGLSVKFILISMNVFKSVAANFVFFQLFGLYVACVLRI